MHFKTVTHVAVIKPVLHVAPITIDVVYVTVAMYYTMVLVYSLNCKTVLKQAVVIKHIVAYAK